MRPRAERVRVWFIGIETLDALGTVSLPRFWVGRKVLPPKSGKERPNLVKCSLVQFPPETVREIAQLLNESDLGEISFEAAQGQKLTIKRQPKFVAAPVAVAAGVTPEIVAEQSALSSASEKESAALVITAPCVGVFHAAKDAVEVGTAVKAKQALGTVESLKIPNDLNAPANGVVSQMWVSDGQGVEWGQPLFEIQPGE